MKQIAERCFRGRLGTATIALVGLAAVALASTPAHAQYYYRVGSDGYGAGIGAPSWPSLSSYYEYSYYVPYYPAVYFTPYYFGYYSPAIYYYAW